MSLNNLLKNAKTTTWLKDCFTDAEWEDTRIRAIVSAEIQLARLERKMDQKAFADFMGVTQGMVSRWENGDYNFTVKKLSEIAVKLGRTFESFFICDKGYLDYKAVEDVDKSKDLQRFYRSIAESRPTQSKQRPNYQNFPLVNNQSFDTEVENCA